MIIRYKKLHNYEEELRACGVLFRIAVIQILIWRMF